ncbi:MAG TPA: DUF2252 domain-containing protein [Actinomycetota bacterium]|nr:DUF2252 domain-containing protein [Actinomycetota bacterium]
MTERMTVEQRRAAGRAARETAPPESHADWEPAADRRDPIGILQAQNQERLPFLVPVRHARMRVSPFTFYRGAAAIMAQDLSRTPDSGLWVQAGGDAHLSNFGAYASPSRQLVFDANDFDETLPAPWEWDLKRLAASLVIAAQNLGLPEDRQRKIAAHTVHAFRTAMQGYAQKPVMDIWYEYLTAQDIEDWKGLPKEEMRERLDRFATKARSRTSLQALAKLTTSESGHLRIKSQPPLLWPLDEVPLGFPADEVREQAMAVYQQYITTTDDHIQELLSRFKIVDIGLKVVGVGSVGTRCFIVLLEGRDQDDPLFLQVKEATNSVLEDYLRPSRYENQGQRVVEGQRMVQAQTDIFLGWTKGVLGKHYYVRQLRDWKGSADVEQGTYKQLRFYAGLCAHTMARGHARSGDPVAMAEYMGTDRVLDNAIAEFSMRYSRQNTQDYAHFTQAIEDGQLPVADSGY